MGQMRKILKHENLDAWKRYCGEWEHAQVAACVESKARNAFDELWTVER